jgi:hypothetical protein
VCKRLLGAIDPLLLDGTIAETNRDSPGRPVALGGFLSALPLLPCPASGRPGSPTFLSVTAVPYTEKEREAGNGQKPDRASWRPPWVVAQLYEAWAAGAARESREARGARGASPAVGNGVRWQSGAR